MAVLPNNLTVLAQQKSLLRNKALQELKKLYETYGEQAEGREVA